LAHDKTFADLWRTASSIPSGGLSVALDVPVDREVVLIEMNRVGLALLHLGHVYLAKALLADIRTGVPIAWVAEQLVHTFDFLFAFSAEHGGCDLIIDRCGRLPLDLPLFYCVFDFIPTSVMIAIGIMDCLS
jgi:hypothetical protein